MGVNVTGWKIGTALGAMLVGYAVLGVYMICSGVVRWIRELRTER